MIAVGDATGMTLGHFDGILFLILFAGYIGLMIKSAMKARAEGKEVEANDEFDAEELKVMSYPKSIIYIVGGAIAIAIGGDLTVDTASRIAIDLGMSQIACRTYYCFYWNITSRAGYICCSSAQKRG